MDLVQVESELKSELEERFLAVASGEPIVTLGPELYESARIYEALGIVRLLMSADSRAFKEALTKAGYSRRYFLAHVAAEDENDERRFAALRYNTALLSCLAANSTALALELSQLSTAAWQPSAEYEDDYCYFRFVNLMIQRSHGGMADADLADLLDRFEQVVAEGGEVCRYRLCRALAGADPVEFSEAMLARLDELIQQHDETRERLAEPGLEALLFWPASFVSVEAIAMLRLAAWNGLRISADLALCPGLIVRDTVQIAVDDPFLELDRIRRMAANP